MQLGYPYPKRTDHLKKLYSTPSKRTFDLRFQSRLQTFSIYNVPIELPKYRLNNGRTLAAQAQYLAKHSEAPQDLFKRDLELEDAHVIQHNILQKMVDEKNLLGYFMTHEQEEPLILSHDGFVVNGNRRLCAMRILLERDKQRYAHFENVDVVILPPATERQIDDLEADLQIHRDIKADYTWTARAFLYKWRKEEHGYTDDEIAQRYELTKPEVREWIQMLEYADRYLASRGIPGQYEEIETDEFAFRQITKVRSKLFKTEGERNVFEQIAYCLIDDSEGGRLYEKISSTGKYLDKVINNLKSALPIASAEVKADDTDLLGGSGDQLVGVLEAVEKENNRVSVRTITAEVVDAELAKEKEKKRTDFVLTQVRKANTSLIEALNGITDTTEKTGIDSQLDSIDKSILSLREWLNDNSKN